MAFLIKVTEFFRDPEAFDCLRDEVLPAIIKRGRAEGRMLRIWSAGCATGEEPYSLALLLADLLDSEWPQWNIKIFATDLDSGAINFARRGIYPASVLNNLPDNYQQRFFEALDHGYRLIKPLRQMVIFGEQDLSRGVPFPRIDLVVCRNLLIYFKPELQQHVLDLFAYSLYQVKGFLFLGKAETARPSKATYELIDKRWKVYQCTNGPSAIPTQSRATRGMLPLPHRPSGEQNVQPRDRQVWEEHRVAPEFELGQLRRFNELLFRSLPIGVAVIDASYRMVTINNTARRLLGIRDAAVDQDFLHAVRGLPYAQVRDAIDMVFRERSSVTLTDLTLEGQLRSEMHYLTLSIALLQSENGLGDLAVVSVVDATEQTQIRRRLEAVQAEQRQLLNELSTANIRLNDVNKELQDANEELQAANEELMLAQEELQATNEEFEATNEELQAANEELETNNEELQATNEELETTNDELTARSNELQQLMAAFANEQRRLNDMVILSPLAMLVVRGPELLAEAATPFYNQLLEGRELRNISLDELLGNVHEGRLVALAHEAYRTDTMCKSERIVIRIPNAEGTLVTHSFMYTISPTHNSNGRVDGLVVYAEDVSEQVEREVAQERSSFSLIVDNAGVAVLALFDVHTTRLIGMSPGYNDLIRLTNGGDLDDSAELSWQQIALLGADQDAISVWNEVLAQRTPLHFPTVRRVNTTDKRATSWDVTLTPILDTVEANTVRFLLVAAAEVKG